MFCNLIYIEWRNSIPILINCRNSVLLYIQFHSVACWFQSRNHFQIKILYVFWERINEKTRTFFNAEILNVLDLLRCYIKNIFIEVSDVQFGVSGWCTEYSGIESIWFVCFHLTEILRILSIDQFCALHL